MCSSATTRSPARPLDFEFFVVFRYSYIELIFLNDTTGEAAGVDEMLRSFECVLGLDSLGLSNIIDYFSLLSTWVRSFNDIILSRLLGAAVARSSGP